MTSDPIGPICDGDRVIVIAGTHKGRTGTVADRRTSPTGAITITVRETSGDRFKTLAKNVRYPD